MRFYEVHDPYYALIKAKSTHNAVNLYVNTVADDDSNNPLINNITEVEREYALVRFSRTFGEDTIEVPIKDVLDDFQNEIEQVLIIDGSLL